MAQRLRLISGLILFLYVLMHFINHILGLASLTVMEQARPYIMSFWNHPVGETILLLAGLVHFTLALYVVYQRRSLRLRRWQIIQLCFGLSIPFLLINHVMATAVSSVVNGTNVFYPQAMVHFWLGRPYLGILQGITVIIVWTHGCIGIHYWLKTKDFYPSCQWLLSQLAVVLPSLALAGYISAGYQTLKLASDRMFMTGVIQGSRATRETVAWSDNTTIKGLIVLAILVATPFLLRLIRHLAQKLRNHPRLSLTDGRSFRLYPGATVLETLRENKVAIASVCGGRGRCTTCRVRISEGLDRLHEPDAVESNALNRIEAIPSVRLACQLRPDTDVTLTPLMPANATAKDGKRPGGLDGMEMNVAVMFVDLRGSTKLGETKLPYDVLFILNQFFAEMTLSLNSTKGHYAQFNGDGLMAIYGLNGGSAKEHAQQAIEGAEEMFRRLGELNEQLSSELKSPLEIGIGIHYGEAIVGAMGPPNNQLITAIGDNVNIAARLESLCKEYNSPFIISETAAQQAGLSLAEDKAHSVAVKGRAKEVKFFALKSPPTM